MRKDLGCTCPAEVFEHIEVGPARPPGPAAIRRRIAIGGRLLVYLIEAEDTEEALANLPSWVTAGQAERDAAGMNRVRLVVVTDHPEAMARVLEAAFETLPDRDERIHLHILPPAAIAGI